MAEYLLLFIPLIGLMLLLALLRVRPRKPLKSVAPDRFEQEMLWADQRRRVAERKAENERPYEPDDIPETTTELSILEFHRSYRDEGYAAAYLLPGRVALPMSTLSNADVFDRYWDMRRDAIWSWRDDNLRDYPTDSAMTAAAHSRALAMRAALVEAGWRVSGHDAYSEAVTVTYLRR
jgi:hypothetical protein